MPITTSDFDDVVVMNSHYNDPFVPDTNLGRVVERTLESYYQVNSVMGGTRSLLLANLGLIIRHLDEVHSFAVTVLDRKDTPIADSTGTRTISDKKAQSEDRESAQPKRLA